MAILDMIPPEWWRQLREELNALDWAAINSAEDARQQAEQERRAKAYDEAIRHKKRLQFRERNRRNYKPRAGRNRSEPQ